VKHIAGNTKNRRKGLRKQVLVKRLSKDLIKDGKPVVLQMEKHLKKRKEGVRSKKMNRCVEPQIVNVWIHIHLQNKKK